MAVAWPSSLTNSLVICEGLEEFWRPENRHAFNGLKRQQVFAIACDQIIGGGVNGALKNAVVAMFALNERDKARWIDDARSVSQLSQGHGSAVVRPIELVQQDSLDLSQ